MENSSKEIRSLEGQIRVGTGRTISGTAIVFNKPSQLLESGGKFFREIILPSALANGFVDTQDICALWNHDDSNGVLARSRNGIGTLSLTVDEYGLKYSFEALNTSLGNEVLEALKSENVFGSSFAFVVKSDRFEKQKDGTFVRYISAFERLIDVSVVVNPAYLASTATARSMAGLTPANNPDDLKAYYAKLDRELADIRSKGCPSDEYYQNLRNQLK